MKLLELFDKAIDVEWVSSNHAEWTIDNTVYVFDIEEEDMPDGSLGYCYVVSFAAKPQGERLTYVNTGTGNQYLVYTTVFQCIKQYVSKFGEAPLSFSADDEGRKRLYSRFVQKFLPGWNLHTQGQHFLATPPDYQPEQ